MEWVHIVGFKNNCYILNHRILFPVAAKDVYQPLNERALLQHSILLGQIDEGESESEIETNSINTYNYSSESDESDDFSNESDED